MNTTAFARFATVLALSLAACGMAQAKGGSLGVGLTIVSSCTASSAHAYGAVSATARTDVAMKAGCSSDAAYMVSMSSDAKAQGASTTTESGDVVVTLTY